MCGLVGVAGKHLILPEIKAFKEMLHCTALRGPHSTGVLSVRTTGKPVMHKLADNTTRFLSLFGDEKGYIMKGGQDMLMGHCRWATVGAVTQKNAHPFDTGNLVGAHNGTLYDKVFTSKDDSRTDSERMFLKMETDGVVPVLEKLGYWSDYAISVFNKQKHTLTLARNHRRPLYFAICKKAPVVFWASELRILMFGLNHPENQIEVEYYKTEPGKVYTFDINNMGISSGKTMFTEQTLPEKIKPEPTTVINNVQSNTVGTYGDDLVWSEEFGCYLSKAFMDGRKIIKGAVANDWEASLDDKIPF